MKTNETMLLASAALEAYYVIACLWEEEPEVEDPWQRNTDI